MKTSKENNSKASKDILLHQIFQEISDEDKEINGDNYLLDDIIPPPQTKLSKIRDIQKKRQWFFIVFLMLSIIYVLFNTDTGSMQNKEENINDDIYAIPKANQMMQEEAITQNIIIKTNPIQLIETNRIQKKEVATQTIIESKKPQNEREKAKEALFMQMQN